MPKDIVCWFEIYVDDIERAKKFYHSVLGLDFEDTPTVTETGDYKMAFFPSDPEGVGVSGALIQMEGVRRAENYATTTIVYFPCEDCSVEESRVKPAGGVVHKSKMSLGEHGFCSICVDSEGNTFGLYSMK